MSLLLKFASTALQTITILTILALSAAAQQYDLAINNGRVMDPETGLDATRNVGIKNGKIAVISDKSLSASRSIDAKGLVVTAGFIDLHQHGQDPASQRLKAFDGVTTALEMEVGAPDVSQFLSSMKGHSLIHYGTTASHLAARGAAFGVAMPAGDILPSTGPATNQPATPEQLEKLFQRLRDQISAGALGIGMGIQYSPGATRLEIIDTFRLAAQYGLPVYTHIRSAGRQEPGSSIESVSEVIAASTISGASLHIVHINSSCGADGTECLSLIAGARARGIDVTTEAYPYIAGMTSISSALFNPGWQEKFHVSYGDLMLPETGERLTKERFEELHSSKQQRLIIMFSNTQPAVDAVIRNPLVMIASDGGPGNPRNAGTYSRILAEYVRKQSALTLMDALRKMSLMPAQMLERSTPAARTKGRMQEGADADVVVFDPATIQDRSTYAKPSEASTGVQFLVVNGVVVIDSGKLVEGNYPGQAIVATASRP
jgi:N-acyl-D-aspartate/D-glutamate deacylase